MFGPFYVLVRLLELVVLVRYESTVSILSSALFPLSSNNIPIHILDKTRIPYVQGSCHTRGRLAADALPIVAASHD